MSTTPAKPWAQLVADDADRSQLAADQFRGLVDIIVDMDRDEVLTFMQNEGGGPNMAAALRRYISSMEQQLAAARMFRTTLIRHYGQQVLEGED